MGATSASAAGAPTPPPSPRTPPPPTATAAPRQTADRAAHRPQRTEPERVREHQSRVAPKGTLSLLMQQGKLFAACTPQTATASTARARAVEAPAHIRNY